MRICYIGDARSIHLQRWIDHFASKGNDIFIISYHGARIRNARVTVIRHELNPFLAPAAYMAETMGIASEIRKIQPHLVHLHYVSIDGFAPALFKNVPLIASVWGSDIFYDFRVNRKFRMVIKHILRKADMVTATSRFLAEETEHHLPPGKTVRVIPFGVNTDFFHPGKRIKRHRPVQLCYIKGLEHHYGPQILISVMPKILEKYPDTRLLMAGGGSQEQPLKYLTDELGLSDSIRFTGPLSPESVKAALSESDIYVMPTLAQEAFGVAALEAQAMGVPVVASRTGGIPEAVLHGETGLLFEPGQPEALLSVLLKLIENPQLRQQMGNSGIKFVRNTYSWEVCAGRVEDLYTSVLHKDD
jgi:glycosyltransferase involved in cell wall biosynthesis